MQDDETTLSEEEELARADTSDPMDEVRSHSTCLFSHPYALGILVETSRLDTFKRFGLKFVCCFYGFLLYFRLPYYRRRVKFL